MPSGGSPQPVQTTSTTTSDPWGPQQPHLKNIFSEAERLYNDPTKPQYYPGQTFADPSQATLQGLAGAQARALEGSPTLAAANNEATRSLSGDYLNADNPYLKGMIDRTAADVLPRLQGSFGRNLPGGLQTRAATMALADSANSLRYGDYNNERNRMAGYASLAPTLAQADYLDPAMLGQVGAQQEAIAQKPIDEAIGRWQFDQNSQQAKLADYLQMVQGNYGGTSNTVGTQFLPRANPLGSLLGGLASGVGILGGTGAFGKDGYFSRIF